MADREKLIEICRRYDGTPPCDTCKTPIGSCSMCGLERLIDYLIANGVTVRERGRWEDEYGGKYANPRYRCPACKERALYKFERDVLGNWKEKQALTDFCPNCGADMRGEEDG